MAQHEHVYAICCRAGYVISGENVKTIEGYGVLNFEVASFIVSEIFKKIHFVTVDIDDNVKRKRVRVSLKSGCQLPFNI